jgi:hypothetical protein
MEPIYCIGPGYAQVHHQLLHGRAPRCAIRLIKIPFSLLPARYLPSCLGVKRHCQSSQLAELPLGLKVTL